MPLKKNLEWDFLYHSQPQKSVYQLEAYSKGGNKIHLFPSYKTSIQNTLQNHSRLLEITLENKDNHGGNQQV